VANEEDIELNFEPFIKWFCKHYRLIETIFILLLFVLCFYAGREYALSEVINAEGGIKSFCESQMIRTIK